MKQLHIRSVLILTVMMIAVMRLTGQVTMPEVMLKSSLNEQMKYLDEHTKIYEDYRAIREDMFQKLKKNVSDTISLIENRTSGFKRSISNLNHTIDSLRTQLSTIKTSLDEVSKSKNSIKVIGLEINKSVYNKVMWTILTGLVVALLIGFLVFKRNLSMISNTKKELQELKTEFEAYRKTSREAREKLTMDHFNELKKLRGG